MTYNNSSQQRPPQPPRRPGGGFFDSIRGTGFRRTVDGRWIGGVSGAIAERTGVDRTLVRGLTVVLCLFFGIGVLLYGLGWLFLPEPDGRIHAEGVLHGVWSGGFIGSCVVVLLGLGNPGFHAPFLFWPGRHGFWGWFGPVLGIGIVVAVIIYAVNHRDDDKHPGGQAGPRGQAGPPHPSGPEGPATPATPGTPGTPGTPDEPQTPETPNEPDAGSSDGETAALPAPDYGDVQPKPTYQPTTNQSTYGPNYGTAPADVRYRAGGPAAVAPPMAPPPPRMITKPAGGPLTLLFAGLAIVAVAAGWLVERELGLPGNGRLIAVGLGLAVVGIGIVLAGAWGRRGGGLTGWAWIGLVVALVVAVIPAAGRVAAVQDNTWTPATVQSAEHGYSVGIGSTTVDLRDLSVPSSGVTTVPVNSGIGDIKVVLPAGETATVKMMGAGDWHRGSADRTHGSGGSSAGDSSSFGPGDGHKHTTKYGDGKAHLVVKIRMGVGNVSVNQAKEGTNS